MITRDADDAAEAVRLLSDAPPARGRARVLVAGLGGPTQPETAGDRVAALRELDGDAPWWEIARRLP
jgi:nucleoside-diphosphate-sugar epimerase